MDIGRCGTPPLADVILDVQHVVDAEPEGEDRVVGVPVRFPRSGGSVVR